MVITGSALYVKPGSTGKVIEFINQFSEITYQTQSASGVEIVVNMEAANTQELELLCRRVKEACPDIVDIAHVYMNLEEEVDSLLGKSEQGTGND